MLMPLKPTCHRQSVKKGPVFCGNQNYGTNTVNMELARNK